MTSRKRVLSLTLGLAAGIVLILLWLRYVDLGELVSRMRNIRALLS